MQDYNLVSCPGCAKKEIDLRIISCEDLVIISCEDLEGSPCALYCKECSWQAPGAYQQQTKEPELEIINNWNRREIDPVRLECVTAFLENEHKIGNIDLVIIPPFTMQETAEALARCCIKNYFGSVALKSKR